MENYIEFIKIQKIKVPLKQQISVDRFIDFMNGDENIYDYDKQIFDFDNEEVIEEEHSYMNNDCKLVCDGKVQYAFNSPFVGYTLLKL